MANILHLQHTHRPLLEGVNATIRAAARAVAAEYTLALRATTTAASPRQRLAKLRAMYVPLPDSDQGSDAVVPSDDSGAGQLARSTCQRMTVAKPAGEALSRASGG